tara:strand:- start:81 stop:353 length:273 start_codon:yes stop_codon:yes gene_type:complete
MDYKALYEQELSLMKTAKKIIELQTKENEKLKKENEELKQEAKKIEKAVRSADGDEEYDPEEYGHCECCGTSLTEDDHHNGDGKCEACCI